MTPPPDTTLTTSSETQDMAHDREDRSDASGPLEAATDVVVVAVWAAVAGLLGAVLWWQLTTLPEVTKNGDSASVAPGELVRQVGIDGWFFVIAGVGGLASGVLLTAWRRRDPLLMVLLLALGGTFAAWLMERVGLALGPEKELVALEGLAEGAMVEMQLTLQATGIIWVWPMAAVLGAVLYLWVLRRPDHVPAHRRSDDEDSAGPASDPRGPGHHRA